MSRRSWRGTLHCFDAHIPLGRPKNIGRRNIAKQHFNQSRFMEVSPPADLTFVQSLAKLSVSLGKPILHSSQHWHNIFNCILCSRTVEFDSGTHRRSGSALVFFKFG